MDTSIFVVSDLHLGGDKGFQMCEAAGRRRLAELFLWIREQASPTRRAWIVIAGDVVDFLAEQPFAAFTQDEAEACRKLESILQSTQEVWGALAKAAERCTVTVMLGNHDVELAMSQPRRRLRERIGGAVEFLFDNEAFTFGDLLVEHGNRYDGWNIVDHEALRQHRSRSSRGEPGEPFPTQPGSELVARVMNQFKKRYPWVDLLKPETAGVIPILAALAGSSFKVLAEATKAAAAASWRASKIDRTGTPTASRFVAEEPAGPSASTKTPVEEVADLFELIERSEGPRRSASAEDRMVGEGAVTIDEELLFRGLRRWGDKDNTSFQIDRENKTYLAAARTLAERGKRKVIVFGHTHHAKRIRLDSSALYLNTGTWADLMRIPEAILSGADSPARAAFADFMVALKTDASALRRLVPTFARIDFDGAQNLEAADVLIFDEGGTTTPISTEEILRRLA